VKTELAITGIGMLTPVGLSAPATLHSIRSGITRLTLQRYPDRLQKWVTGAVIPVWLPYGRERRLGVLALRAMQAALDAAGIAHTDAEEMRATGVIFAVPESVRPAYRFPTRPVWNELTAGRNGFQHLGAVEVIAGGACSALLALTRVEEVMRAKRLARCLIGGIDTQLQLRTIRWHEDNRRLKCSYVVDGLIPGEGACFLVVEPEHQAVRRGTRPLARVASVSIEREHAPILSDQPNTAGALTGALRKSLDEAGISAAGVGMVWSDLNGESYRAREWAFSEIRLGFTTATELMHPADCYGDVGAATDASLLALAAMSHLTNWADGKPLVVFAGSEAGLRGAAVITPAEREPAGLEVSRGEPRVFSAGFDLPPSPELPDDFRVYPDPRHAHFEWSLREEHRDELASLYYQRTAILADPGIPWIRLREPEQRLLNHLDAIVAGGPSAMAAVADGVRAEEEGVCFGGALLIGALPTARNLDLIAAAFETASPASIAGIGSGLLHAPISQRLTGFISRLATDGDPLVRAMAARVAACRRIDISEHLSTLLATDSADVLSAAAEAAWKPAAKDTEPLLSRLLDHVDTEVRRSALLALLVLAPARTAAYARAHADDNPSFGGAVATCIGIAGRLSDASVLLDMAQRRDGGSAISALGILGAPETVPDLLHLARKAGTETRRAASAALSIICGDPDPARLERTRDPDEDETAALVECWSEWWTTTGARLPRGTRLRHGAPFSLNACVLELREPSSAREQRARAHLELAARTGADVPYEAEWFVPKQLTAIEAWRSWVMRHGGGEGGTNA
jgi:3-oxoacyl-[acyl-carrier-protein] synthase I